MITLLMTLGLTLGAHAATEIAEPEHETTGGLCKRCDRAILNDEWIKASPARRAEIAAQLTALDGKATPPLDDPTTSK